MSGDIQVRLYRDALTTSWGFRLQGGKDVGAPLIVQKITLGTPSDGELQKGDTILEIQGTDTSRMSHIEAQDKIRNSGGSLLLRVLRYGSLTFPPAQSLQKPKQRLNSGHSTDFGVDYNRKRAALQLQNIQVQQQPGFMLSRVQESLSIAPPNDNSQYLHNLPDNYQQDITHAQSPQPWMDQNVIIQSHSPNYYNNRKHDQCDQPAWLGSLRSSGQALPCDRSLVPQPQAYNPCLGRQSPVNRQVFVGGQSMTDAAKAVHLQYNSPLGLYSKSTATEAMTGQLKGTHAEGSLRILGEAEVRTSQTQHDVGISDF